MPSKGVSKRRKQSRHLADPASHGRTIDVDAAASKNLRLAVQRLMIAELRYEHMREQRWSGPSFFDGSEAWALNDRLAARQLILGRI